jgi:hypothetical protein
MEEQETLKDEIIAEEESPEKKRQYILNMFILIIGIIVVLGLILLSIKFFAPKSVDDLIKEIAEKGETKDGYLYNGFVFIHQNELWHTRWQYGSTMLSLHFHYGPRDVENVIMIGSLENNTDTSKFYLTFDPSEKNISLISLASSELALNLVKGMNVKITPACLTNSTEECYDRPIITCENTNKSVIFVKTSESAAVVFDKNCITVKGPGNELLKAVDKFLYRSYKIMQPPENKA